MNHAAPARTAARWAPSPGLAFLAVPVAVVVATLGYQSVPSSAVPAGAVPRRSHQGAFGEADGAVPNGVLTVFDASPVVAKLDPSLLRALRQAATDAADDRVTLYVNSGWRSSAYQSRLFREATAKYGSAKEAARWVATPDRSAHVSGEAVDIGRSDAAFWLSQYGVRYGLCRIYANEPWHFELRRESVGHGCPPMYADPTRDPRMQ